MKCSRCGKFGIYWVQLGTMNEHTYCPHCLSVNWEEYIREGDEDVSDEADPNGAAAPDDNKSGREYQQEKEIT